MTTTYVCIINSQFAVIHLINVNIINNKSIRFASYKMIKNFHIHVIFSNRMALKIDEINVFYASSKAISLNMNTAL